MPTPKSKSKKNGKSAAAHQLQNASTGRPVLYSEDEVRRCRGEDAITVEQAKELLGWETETEQVKFGGDYLLVDEDGAKVRCSNNVGNRPLAIPNVESLKQEILNRRWQYNGEPIIIGKTGLILNGQHTLIALILAEQVRTGNQKLHWEELWRGPVTLEKLIVLGIDESDKVVNTMDTAKPRTLWEVICRSAHFAKNSLAERKALSRLTDYAVRLLWHRAGLDANAFAPKRTHSEALDFISRHFKLLEAVKHIWEEDKQGAISKFISPGTAAGMLYLMGTGNSDGDQYRNADNPGDRLLDFELWDKAQEFWVLLASGAKELQALRELRRPVGDDADEYHGHIFGAEGGARQERMAAIAKAWQLFSAGKKLTADNMRLTYVTTTEGLHVMTEPVDFGGIDIGEPAEEVDKGDQEELTVEEVEERKAEEAKARQPKKTNTGNTSLTDPAKGEAPSLKDQLESLRTLHNGKCLLFSKGSHFVAWDQDAHAIAKITRLVVQSSTGLARVEFPVSQLKSIVDKLGLTGHRCILCEQQGKETIFQDPKDFLAGQQVSKPAEPQPTPSEDSEQATPEASNGDQANEEPQTPAAPPTPRPKPKAKVKQPK